MFRNTIIAAVFYLSISAMPQFATASDPDWANMDYTSHSTYQAVDNTGNGTFLPSPPIKMRGVILNNPEELLDPTPSAPVFMGGQWQIFLQSVDQGDSGGTACWVGQFYGNLPWLPPTASYSDTEWLMEMDRLNYDPVTGHYFRAGDLVEVRARVPGLNYKGKTNINEAHNKAPENNFDVYLLEAGYGLPDHQVIPTLQIANGFDSSRLTGGEYYQSTLTRINSVEITNGTWEAGQYLTVTDGTASFALLLSCQGDFNDHTAPVGKFDVLGVFDQESTDLTAGYYLWVTKQADIIHPAEAPQITQAVSRKEHGSAGSYDLNLALEPPNSTECRKGGPTTIILTFSEGIKALDGTIDTTEVSLSAGNLQSLSMSMQKLEMTLEISGVPNSSTLTVTLNGIVDLADNPLVDNDLEIKVKTGDATPDGIVNIFDLASVKQALFQEPNENNFINDINIDGIINIFDLEAVKTRLFQ